MHAAGRAPPLKDAQREMARVLRTRFFAALFTLAFNPLRWYFINM